MDALALSTFLLAIATVALVWETRKSRKEQERQRKELAFRAALVEVAENIVSFERWNPNLGVPDAIWQERRLTFTMLQKLLETVWIHQQLFHRILYQVLFIKRIEDVLRSKLKPSEIGYTADEYYLIDLLLKQLTCYVSCELRRQHLEVPKGAWLENIRMFKPLLWPYGDPNKSPEAVAEDFTAKYLPPSVRLPQEPDDPAFLECRLEVLISQARQAQAKQASSIRSAVSP